VGKQGVALGEVADAAALDGDVDAARAVEEGHPVEGHVAVLGRLGPQDGHEQGGLAGAVRPGDDDRGPSGAKREVHRQRAEPAPDLHIEAGRAHGRDPARTATRTAKATATMTMERLCAARRSDSSAV